MLITQTKTNWKFLAIVLVLAVIVGGGIWFLSNLTPEEPKIPEKEVIKETEAAEELDTIGFSEEAGARIINAFFEFEGFYDSEEIEIVFSTLEGDEILRVKIKDQSGYLPELGLEELRLVNLVYSADPSLRINEVAIDDQLGIFYFFLADEIICGATGNCSWVFYKYDSGKDEFSNFQKEEDEYDKFENIFGSIARDKLVVSPDGKKVAFVSGSRGGASNIYSEVWVIDLIQDTINDPNVKDGQVINDHIYNLIYSIHWLNGDCVLLKTEHTDWVEKKVEEFIIIREIIFREYQYCYLVDKLELISEEVFEEIQG